MDSLIAEKGQPATLDIIETMVQTREMRTSSGLGERCEIHGCGLNFYSSKEQGFKCLSCLINKEDVQYIDKSYIASLDKFNEVREFTKQAILDSDEAQHDLGKWKEDIRDMIMRVREQFLCFIDEYTQTLKKQLNDIEQQADMRDFIGEDRKQEYRLKNLQEKHEAISEIISAIESTPRHQKAKAVRDYSDQMQRLESEVTLCNNEIIEQRQKIKKAMQKTVNLESLSTRVFGQFYSYI